MTQQIPNCFYRISVKALILDNEKRFLLTKEDNGFRELPGGGLDFEEDPQTCIKREITEEMGLKVNYVAKNPSYFLTTNHATKGHKIANIVYETRVDDLDFTASDECVEIRFFTKEEAEKEGNLFSNVIEFIKLYSK